MSSELIITDAGPSPEEQIAALRKMIIEARRVINAARHQLRKLAGTGRVDSCEANAPVQCLHCGWSWHPNNESITPKCCARCGTCAWNKPPRPGRRTPSDPPAPSWRDRKGKYRGSQPFKNDVRSVIVVKKAPAEAFIPPSVRAAMPPPPAFTGNLSDRLAQLRAQSSPQQEEQPERTIPAPVAVDEAPDGE